MTLTLDDVPVAIEKLRLEPDDIIIVSTEWVMTVDQARELATRIQAQLGVPNKCLVATHGLKISTLTRAKIEEMAQ